jgi:8-oxo-dGTP pyrophosphatase MutT (NUDIX family)
MTRVDGPADWPAIAAALAGDGGTRVPFCVQDGAWAVPAGSVARSHLQVLARWPEALRVDEAAVTLTLPAAERTPFFTQANARLRADGLITAWRDETFALPALDDGHLLATLERAASRFWGTLTLGAHCNGHVLGDDGRPSHLWIARRAYSKPTDPGLLDNLIGGGVPLGQSPAASVVREGWEEAGLRPAQMAGLRPGRRLRLARPIPEGFQREELSAFDLALPPGLVPANQDGEVHSITLMPVANALARAAAGDMTVDAALVTLDFALRHRLLPQAQAQVLAARSQALWQGLSRLDR